MPTFTCGVCSAPIVADEEHACSICFLHVHRQTCGTMKPNKWNAQPTLVCNRCMGNNLTEPSASLPMSVLHFQQMMSQFSHLSSLINNQGLAIAQCEQNIQELKNENVDIKQKISQIESKLQSGDTIGSFGSNLEDIIAEVREREVRRSNLIFANLPETSRDVQEVKSLLSELSNSFTSIDTSRLIRIGKTQVDTPRLLRLTVTNASEALSILKAKGGLSNSARYKNVRIRADLTPQQSRHLKELQKELETRKSLGEKDITIKYIKNTPQIVNISQKRGRDEAFSPEQTPNSKLQKPLGTPSNSKNYLA